MSPEYTQGVSPKPDLSSLSGNVKAIEKVRTLIKSDEGVTRDGLLGILRDELATMTDNKAFFLKAKTLRGAIEGIEEHQEIGVEDILAAMKIQKEPEGHRGFSFGKLFSRGQRN